MADDPPAAHQGRRNHIVLAAAQPSPQGALVAAEPRSDYLQRLCPPSAVRDRLRQTQFLDGLTDSALHQLAKLVTP